MRESKVSATYAIRRSQCRTRDRNISHTHDPRRCRPFAGPLLRSLLNPRGYPTDQEISGASKLRKMFMKDGACVWAAETAEAQTRVVELGCIAEKQKVATATAAVIPAEVAPASPPSAAAPSTSSSSRAPATSLEGVLDKKGTGPLGMRHPWQERRFKLVGGGVDLTYTAKNGGRSTSC